MIDSQVSGKSTTEPPRSITRELLQVMNSSVGGVPWALVPLILWRNLGGIDDIRVPATGTRPSPAQSADWQLITTHSKDALLVLASTPFLNGTQVQASPWSDVNGIQPYTVRLQVQGGDKQQTWAGIDRTEYESSVAKVPGRVTPGVAIQARAEGPYPFLSFAIAIGMHQQPDKYPNTATVIDIATGWVATVVHQLKHLQRVPRAYEPPFNLPVNTVLERPGFTAFPAGHAAQAYALAALLTKLLEADLELAAKLARLAGKLAETREKAGLHCALDTERGRDLGTTLAGWMTDPATLADPRFAAWSALFAHAREEWK